MSNTGSDKIKEWRNLKDFKDEEELRIPFFISERIRKNRLKEFGHTTKEDPIVINHEDALGDVVGAEYFILEKLFGERDRKWKMISQTLLGDNDKKIDCIKIFIKETQHEEEVYFNISNSSV